MSVDDKCVLVAALVAAEPEVRQGYFLFCARDALLRAGALPRAGDVFRAGGFARRAAAERAGDDAERAGFGAETRRTSGVAARCTIVNRVWSPIV